MALTVVKIKKRYPVTVSDLINILLYEASVRMNYEISFAVIIAGAIIGLPQLLNIIGPTESWNPLKLVVAYYAIIAILLIIYSLFLNRNEQRKKQYKKLLSDVLKEEIIEPRKIAEKYLKLKLELEDKIKLILN